MNGAFIGVDVGTGSARAGVFDDEGRLLAYARRPIAIWREAGEIVEQSSEDIWRAATAAVREAVDASALSAEAFAGVGFDATTSLVVVDPAGRPLSVSPTDSPERNVIVWMDHRAAIDAERINATGHEVLRYVGGRISPEMQVPKLAWLAREKPATFAAAGHFFDLSDYLSWRATGVASLSLCAAVCKFAYLAHERRWAADFFDAVGLGALQADGFARVGSEIAAPGTPLGSGLTRDAAAAMGLRPGLPVGAGLVDAHAGALATLGASAAGEKADPRRRLALILGTSSCCMAVADEPRFIDGVWGPSYSALSSGQWLVEGGQSAFGAAIDHVLRAHPAFPALAARADDVHAALEREIVARAGGLSQAARLAESLHVLPDFLGHRSPDADPAARGAIAGLDLGESLNDLQALYVATLAGLAYGLARVIAELERGGFAFETIVVSGGASQSALVRQIVADATRQTVAAPETPEPVLLGSAMIGAVAAGRLAIGEAMGSMSRLGATATPAGGEIAALHARKRRAYEILRRAERETRKAMSAPAAWPEVVIFDCDGVLVDSEVLAMSVIRRLLEEAGLCLSDEETRERFLGVRVDSGIRKVEAELGAPLPKSFPERVSRATIATFERELKGMEGVRQAVGGLRARVCVASSSGPDRLRSALRVTGYEAMFAPNIFSGAQVARGKPHPDLFLFAARAMGAAPADCLVIEDSVAGVEAARRAGMSVFGFVGGSHYSAASQVPDLTAAGAELIFDDMARLPDIVAESAARRAAREAR
jgi:D-ribulokinase